MQKPASRHGRSARFAGATKYDAHHTVLNKTYGALADLRRELSDSKADVAERHEILQSLSACKDSQRAWLLMEDYFEKLSLSHKDFSTSQDWWPRWMKKKGKARLEELAILFLRATRPLPTELLSYADAERFAEIEQAEQESEFLRQIEHWLFPPAPPHLDSPRAWLKVQCEVTKAADHPGLHQLAVSFNIYRPRTGERCRPLADILDLTSRSNHEQELFSPDDWEFIQWLCENYSESPPSCKTLTLQGLSLLQWLARWGATDRLLTSLKPIRFQGQIISLTPHLEETSSGLSFTHRAELPSGKLAPVDQVRLFDGRPPLALVDNTFYLLRNAPPSSLIEYWAQTPAVPVRKLSHRLRTQLRKTQSQHTGNWEQLCTSHKAIPQFVFELTDDTVRLHLNARSERDNSAWQWTGQEWQRQNHKETDKPEILEDPRLDAAVEWLRRLDWFTPEQGVWIGDANENFLNTLATAWPDKPTQAEYLGNPAFHRLFLSPKQLRPRLIVKGSGIDWLSVSAEWEQEGFKLTQADIERLAAATSRFVKLPNAGWLELDTQAVEKAHQTIADLGLEDLTTSARRVGLEQAAHLHEDTLQLFGNGPEVKALRNRLANFDGIPQIDLPKGVQADLRPYQREGFDFLVHLTELRLGGILADDMGLGKTLQTLTWLAWLKQRNPKRRKPTLVICPASVLHNWRREANRFTPDMKVLVLESGSARHNLRKQIPQYDLIVTNYALLRRDLEALQKFSFGAVILDEAQFIKNPTAQVTQSVKQLKASQRLALTGTPLENRLLDLWSITDFVQPRYLGTQQHFAETYEPRGEGAEGQTATRIARRRLSAKLRPLMLRRLKRQVAKDLPDRIEERRDCELGELQRKLYLAELRRSREQVLNAVAEKGLNKSKLHVLAALTRLRQICCHPQLVGNDSLSGKTETLFELLEPLLSEGQKVLIFSQFVQMLRLLEKECHERSISTHILTGDTKERHTVVQQFQDDPNASIFLLSLRAAGTGLNLTTASYVVLYDPWWNPAVEAQAIDRSHRIGQTQTVNAYRLIAPGTVEEKIWELQQRKAQTISDVLGEEGFARNLSQTDLEYLFSED